VPTDVGEGLVLPDGTYVTDEPMATGPGAGGSGAADPGKGMPVSGAFRIGDIVDIARRLGKAGKQAVTSKIPYGNYKLNFFGDVAKKLNDQLGYDQKYPAGMSDEERNFWRDYQNYVNRVRNELYGSALTQTEAQAFEKSVASVASTTDSLIDSLESQFRTILQSLETRRSLLGGAGYNVSEIDKQIAELRSEFAVLLQDAEEVQTSDKENADANPDVDNAMEEARRLKNG